MSLLMERIGVRGRVALFVLAVVMLQIGLMADLVAFDAVGDLVLLAVLAAGSVAGSDRGALFGFGAGVFYDLLLDTPFGLSALSYVVAGYAMGWIASRVIQPRWWFHILAGVIMSSLVVLMTVGVARLLGLAYPMDDLVRMVLVVAAWNALLILPSRRLLRAVFGDIDTDRYRIALS